MSNAQNAEMVEIANRLAEATGLEYLTALAIVEAQASAREGA